METGQYIQDGTVKWIVADIRDGDMVGDISFHPTLLPGHIKANRANWTDASVEIPRLLAWVQANNMLTTDATDESKYLYDSENDILTLPNVLDRVLQGGNAVEALAAGLPNITGTYEPMLSMTAAGTSGSVLLAKGLHGAFEASETTKSGHYFNKAGDISAAIPHGVRFDAARSSPIYGASTTVQPPAIVMIPQIKY